MELRLRKLRNARHLTQEDLAAQIGQTARVVGSWEREQSALPLEDAARIADVLNCTLDELAGRDFPASSDSLTTNERQLVDLYRDTDERGRRSIMGNAIQQQDEFDRGGTENPRGNESGVA